MNKRIAKTFALGAACLFPLAFFAQQKEGQAWSWGFGRNGQLGLGSQGNYSLPHQIKGVSFVDIDTKRSISAGVTKDGRLFTWGKNRHGVLGHYPPNLNVLVPRRVDLQQRVAEVSCGYQHLCVVTQEGQAFVWGFDQIKSSFRSIETSQSRKSDQNIAPLKIDIKDVKHAACANQYIAFLRKDGRVFVLGDTSLKGVNGVKAKSKTQLLELGINKVVKVVSGINFTLALNDEGKVFVWGNNTFGQLGTGGLRNVDQPTVLDTLMKQQIVDIACGDNFAGVVTKNGQVYTWGFGNQGQLGHGDKSDQYLPRKVSSLHAKVRSISCGGAHTALITQNGKLLVVGRGRQGQLGRELKDQSNSGYALSVKQVEQLPSQSTINKVVCGGNHTIILLNEIL